MEFGQAPSEAVKRYRMVDLTVLRQTGRAKLWLVLVILSLLAILVAACSSAPTPPSTPPTASVLASTEEPEEPVLPTTLKKDCHLTESSVRGFNKAGLKVGEKAVNFTLKDTSATKFRLSRLLVEKPVMLVFGSFT